MREEKKAAPAAVAGPAGEYPPLPKPNCPNIWGGAYSENQMRAYVDADRAVLAQWGAAPTTQAAPADTLAEIVGCIDAANAEGLDDALVNNTDARLTDLVQRRLLPAFYVAIAAQAAQQPAVQHAGALEACRAACDRIIEQYDGVTAGIDWHALRGGIDRALAAHPAAPVAQGDAEDAARYRWLRARCGRIADEYDGCSDQLLAIRESDSHFEGWDVDPASLDRAIDAARAQAKKGGA